MSEIITIESRRRRANAHGSTSTAPRPLLDEVLRRLGPNGWLVVDADGRVIDCSEPR